MMIKKKREYTRARMRNIDQNLHVRFTFSIYVRDRNIKKNSKKKMKRKKSKKKELSEKCLCVLGAKDARKIKLEKNKNCKT